jgi:16S rRNA (guanine527-N7)-methyltransferase
MLPEFSKMQSDFAEYDLTLTESQYALFDIYAQFLCEYNEKVNLTAITTPEGIAVKHFLDSVIPLAYIEVTDGMTIADIGTGAGFPGVPMVIMNPGLRLTLIESNGKRAAFLHELSGKLGIPFEIIKARSEDCARGEADVFGTEKKRVLRAAFDIVTARAVAPLPQLAEYCMPFLKEGGVFLALKGSSEIYESGAAAVEELGGDLEDFAEYTLPTGEVRRLFVIEKTSITPKKYPRSNALIKKKALG